MIWDSSEIDLRSGEYWFEIVGNWFEIRRLMIWDPAENDLLIRRWLERTWILNLIICYLIRRWIEPKSYPAMNLIESIWEESGGEIEPGFAIEQILRFEIYDLSGLSCSQLHVREWHNSFIVPGTGGLLNDAMWGNGLTLLLYLEQEDC